MATSLDDCPTCGRHITDVDPDGCELSTGQRYCLSHLTAEACSNPDDQGLWKDWTAFQTNPDRFYV